MKLHLPKGLRTALLACMAAFTGIGTTLSTVTMVGGVFAVSIAPAAWAEAQTVDAATLDWAADTYAADDTITFTNAEGTTATLTDSATVSAVTVSGKLTLQSEADETNTLTATTIEVTADGELKLQGNVLGGSAIIKGAGDVELALGGSITDFNKLGSSGSNSFTGHLTISDGLVNFASSPNQISGLTVTGTGTADMDVGNPSMAITVKDMADDTVALRFKNRTISSTWTLDTKKAIVEIYDGWCNMQGSISCLGDDNSLEIRGNQRLDVNGTINISGDLICNNTVNLYRNTTLGGSLTVGVGQTVKFGSAEGNTHTFRGEGIVVERGGTFWFQHAGDTASVKVFLKTEGGTEHSDLTLKGGTLKLQDMNTNPVSMETLTAVQTMSDGDEPTEVASVIASNWNASIEFDKLTGTGLINANAPADGSASSILNISFDRVEDYTSVFTIAANNRLNVYIETVDIGLNDDESAKVTTFSGTTKSKGDFTKTGAGTLQLGTHTAAGGIDVQAGTLTATGVLSAGGAVSVASGATLVATNGFTATGGLSNEGSLTLGGAVVLGGAATSINPGAITWTEGSTIDVSRVTMGAGVSGTLDLGIDASKVTLQNANVSFNGTALYTWTMDEESGLLTRTANAESLGVYNVNGSETYAWNVAAADVVFEVGTDAEGNVSQSAETLTFGSGSGGSAGATMLENTTLDIHEGSTVKLNAWAGTKNTTSTTDKVDFKGDIMLDGGTLFIFDGAYNFSGNISVADGKTGTLRSEWSKGYCLHSLTTAADSTLVITSSSNRQRHCWTLKDDTTDTMHGTLEMKGAGSHNFHVNLDHQYALGDAEIKMNSSEMTGGELFIGLNQEAHSIRNLTSVGTSREHKIQLADSSLRTADLTASTLTVTAASGSFRGVVTQGVTLNIAGLAEDATYTLDSLTIDSGAQLTLGTVVTIGSASAIINNGTLEFTADGRLCLTDATGLTGVEQAYTAATNGYSELVYTLKTGGTYVVAAGAAMDDSESTTALLRGGVLSASEDGGSLLCTTSSGIYYVVTDAAYDATAMGSATALVVRGTEDQQTVLSSTTNITGKDLTLDNGKLALDTCSFGAEGAKKTITLAGGDNAISGHNTSVWADVTGEGDLSLTNSGTTYVLNMQGNLNVNGTLTVAGGSVTLTSNASLGENLQGVIVNNGATMVYQAAGAIQGLTLGNAGEGAATLSFLGAINSGAVTLNGAAAVRRTATEGGNSTLTGTFSGTGDLEISNAAGRLDLAGDFSGGNDDFTHTGDITFTGAGTTSVGAWNNNNSQTKLANDGDVEVAGGATTTVTCASSIANTKDLLVNGSLEVMSGSSIANGGAVKVAGTLTLNSGASLQGTSAVVLNGGTLNVNSGSTFATDALTLNSGTATISADISANRITVAAEQSLTALNVSSTKFCKQGEGTLSMGTLNASGSIYMGYEGALTMTGLSIADGTTLIYDNEAAQQILLTEGVLTGELTLAGSVIVDVRSYLGTEGLIDLGLSSDSIAESSIIIKDNNGSTLVAQDGRWYVSGLSLLTDEWDNNWAATTLSGTPKEMKEFSSMEAEGVNIISMGTDGYLVTDPVADKDTAILITGTSGKGAEDSLVVVGGQWAGAEGSAAQEHDSWLKLTGGSVNVIVGGNYCQGGSLDFTGDSHILVDYSGTGSVTYIVGGNHMNDADDTPVFTGDTWVSIKSDSLVGAVVGGSTASHTDKSTTLVGDTHVCIYTPQTQEALLGGPLGGVALNHIIGGNAAMKSPEAGSGTMTHDGDSTVLLDFRDVADASMNKTIVGGSYAQGSWTSSQTGSTSVEIQNADSITLEGDVVAGAMGAADSSISGSVNLKINAATCEGLVIGGSYDASAADATTAATFSTGSHNMSLSGGFYHGDVIGGHYDAVAGTVANNYSIGDITLHVGAVPGLNGTLYGGSYSQDNGNATRTQGDISILIGNSTVLGDVYAAGYQGGSAPMPTASPTVTIDDATLGSADKEITVSGGYKFAEGTTGSTVTGERALVFEASGSYEHATFADFDKVTIGGDCEVTAKMAVAAGSTLAKAGEGLLTLAASAEGALELQSGGLNLNGHSLNGLTAADGTTLIAAQDGSSVGALTLNDVTLVLGSSGIAASSVELTAGSQLALSVPGAVDGGAQLTINTYTLITGLLSVDDIKGITLDSEEAVATHLQNAEFFADGYTFRFVGDSLVLSNATSQEWDAAANDTWDADWSAYMDAVFNGLNMPDSGAEIVTITGDVSPESVIVSHESGEYVFAGAEGDAITGATTLTKSGNGTLTIELSNSYTGGTKLEGGVLNAAAANALGLGTLNVTGGVLNVSAALGNSSAAISGGKVNVNAGGTLGSGALTVSGGELRVSDALDNSSVSISGGTVAVWLTPNGTLGTGALTVSGGELNVVGALANSSITISEADSTVPTTVTVGPEGSLGTAGVALNGGTLVLNKAVDNTITFGGGTLHYKVSDSLTFDQLAYTSGSTIKVTVDKGEAVTWQVENGKEPGLMQFFGNGLQLAAGDGESGEAVLKLLFDEYRHVADSGAVFNVGENTKLIMENTDTDGASALKGQLAGTGTVEIIANGGGFALERDNSAFAGTLILSGSGKITLPNTNAGGANSKLVLNGVSVKMDDGTNLGMASVTVQGTNTLSNQITSTISGALKGDGTLTVGDGSTLKLTGDLSGFSGTLRDNASVACAVDLGADGSAANGNIFADGAELTGTVGAHYRVNYDSGTAALNAVVSGEGTRLTHLGDAALTLTEKNTATGKLTVNANTGDVTIATDAEWKGAIENNDTLTVDGTAAAITNNGTLTVNGEAGSIVNNDTLTVAGTAAAITNNGTLSLQDGASIAGSTGGSLAVSGTATSTGDISATSFTNNGTLTMSGSTVLTLENGTAAGGNVTASAVVLNGADGQAYTFGTLTTNVLTLNAAYANMLTVDTMVVTTQTSAGNPSLQVNLETALLTSLTTWENDQLTLGALGTVDSAVLIPLLNGHQYVSIAEYSYWLERDSAGVLTLNRSADLSSVEFYVWEAEGDEGWADADAWGGTGTAPDGTVADGKTLEQVRFTGTGSSTVILGATQSTNSVFVAGGKEGANPIEVYTFAGNGTLTTDTLTVSQGGLIIGEANTESNTDTTAVVVNNHTQVDGTLTVVDSLTTGSLSVGANGTLTNEGSLTVTGALTAAAVTNAYSATLSMGDGSNVGTLSNGYVSTSGTVTLGAAELNKLTISGSTTVTGALEAGVVENNGSLSMGEGSLVSTLEGGSTTTSGTVAIHEVLDTVKLTVESGTTTVTYGLRADSVENKGTLSVGAALVAETVTNTGTLSMGAGSDVGAISGGAVTLNGAAEVDTVTDATSLTVAAGTTTIGTLSMAGENQTVTVADGAALQLQSDTTLAALTSNGTVSMGGNDLTLTATTTAGGTVTADNLSLTGTGNSFTALTLNSLTLDTSVLGTGTAVTTTTNSLACATTEGQIGIDITGTNLSEVLLGHAQGGTFTLISGVGSMTAADFALSSALSSAIEAASLQGALSVKDSVLTLTLAQLATDWDTSDDSIKVPTGTEPEDPDLYDAPVYESITQVQVKQDTTIDLTNSELNLTENPEGLVLNNVSGDGEGSVLELVGDGMSKDLVTLKDNDSLLEDPTAETKAADISAEKLTVQVSGTDGQETNELELGTVELNSAGLQVNSNIALSVDTLEGDAGSRVSGEFMLTDGGERGEDYSGYNGSYEAGTVIHVMGGEHTLAAHEKGGLSVNANDGSTTTITCAEGTAVTSITAGLPEWGNEEQNHVIVLDNANADGTVNPLQIDEYSQINGGTLRFAVDVHEVAEGSGSEVASGAAVNLNGVDIIVTQAGDAAANPDINLAGGTTDRVIATIGAGDGAVAQGEAGIMPLALEPEEPQAAENKVTLEGAFFDRNFKAGSARMDGNKVVGDLNTRYYTDELAQTGNGTEGMEMIDMAHFETTAQANRDAYADLAGVLDAMDAHRENGAAGAADRLASAVAGASTTALGMALSDDMERQLKAIRNRTTTMGGLHGQQAPAFNAWINAEGDYRDMDADGTMAGYTVSSWGGTVGFDVAFSECFSAGLAFTAMYGDLDADAADVASADLDTYYISAFTRKSCGNWVYTCVGSIGLMDATMERTVNYGGSYTSSGDTEGLGLGLMYEVGYKMALNEDRSTILQPVVNVTWRHIEVDAYTESGSDASLRLSEQELDTLTFGLGARLQTTVGEQTFNHAMLLEARALAKLDAGDRQSEVTSTLVNAGATSAHLSGAELDAFGVELGAGLTIPLGAESGALFTDVSVELRGDYSNVNATIGYKLSF